jgi:uncharacterized protein (TIRG00374 family)
MADQALATEHRRPARWRQALQIVLAIAVVAVIFVRFLPNMADFSEVWATIRAMTWGEISILAIAAIWNILSYLPVQVASLPGLSYLQAFLVTQASTAIANTVPAGGAVGVAVQFAMYRSFAIPTAKVSLSVAVSGIWNNFVKFGMPIVALALLAIQGKANAKLLLGALAGVVALAVAVGLFALVLAREGAARRIGERLGTIWSGLRRLVRRPPATGWGDAAVRFRTQTLDLLEGRWLRLTVATLVSHLSLYLVLLLALRDVGVSEDEVSWIEVLAAFAFARLITALPITPGGLGVVELLLSAALIRAGGDRTQVVAAVLVYRALTYLLPIPLGAVCYLIWARYHRRQLHYAEESAPDQAVPS